MDRKHSTVCSLSFLPPLWWQTGFLPCFSTLAPSSFPFLYSQCGSQPCTAEFFCAWSFGQGTPGWVSQGLRNASEIPLHPSLTLSKASVPKGRGGRVPLPGTGALTWMGGLPGIVSPRRYPSPAQPSFTLCIPTWLSLLQSAPAPPPTSIHCPTSQGM